MSEPEEDLGAGCTDEMPLVSTDFVVHYSWEEEAHRRLGVVGSGKTLEGFSAKVGEVRNGIAVWTRLDPERFRRTDAGEMEVFANGGWWSLASLDAGMASAVRPMTVREAVARKMCFEEYPAGDPREARAWLSGKVGAVADEIWGAMQEAQGWE